MLAFDPLQGELSNDVLCWGQIPPIGAPLVRVRASQTQGCQQRLEGKADVGGPMAQYLGSHLPRVVIDGMPSPSGRLCVADAAPHRTELRLNSSWPPRSRLRRGYGMEPLLVDLWEIGGLFLSVFTTVAELTRSTRTISRTPQPLRVRSTMRCVTAGKRPVS